MRRVFGSVGRFGPARIGAGVSGLNFLNIEKLTARLAITRHELVRRRVVLGGDPRYGLPQTTSGAVI